MNRYSKCQHREAGCMGVGSNGQAPFFEHHWKPGIEVRPLVDGQKCPGFLAISNPIGITVSGYIGGEYEITETLTVSLSGFHLKVESLVDTSEYKLSIKEGIKTFFYLLFKTK